MFDVCNEPFVDLKSSKLIHLYVSLNQPVISAGAGMSAEPAQGYVFACQDSSQRVILYVGLFFPQSDHRILYTLPPVDVGRLQEAISQAESFANEMGFMLDNSRLSSISTADRNDLIRTIPFFYRDLPLYYAALTDSEIEFKKSKVETSQARDAQVDAQRLFIDRYVELVSML